MNRVLYTGDCLDVLEGGDGIPSDNLQTAFNNILNDSDRLPDESVDLIYLDPPFNSNSNYNLPFKGRDKAARPVRAFKDTWEWSDRDDALLAELKAHPLTRTLASIVELAMDVSGARTAQGGGGEVRVWRPIYFTWDCACGL